jgi:hypothetical protein
MTPVYDDIQADPPNNANVLPLADVCILVIASSTIHIKLLFLLKMTAVTTRSGRYVKYPPLPDEPNVLFLSS